MPPKVSYEQAKGFAKAFLKGQPHKATIAVDAVPRQDRRAQVVNLRSCRRHSRGLDVAPFVIDRLIAGCRARPIRTGSVGIDGSGGRVTGAEIFLEHDRASFGNRMMWLPVALTPVVSRRRRRRCVQPPDREDGAAAASALVLANGVQGTYLHLRGIAQRPGGWRFARYNAEMGPPMFAPLLFSMVGGMGLLAAILRREP